MKEKSSTNYYSAYSCNIVWTTMKEPCINFIDYVMDSGVTTRVCGNLG